MHKGAVSMRVSFVLRSAEAYFYAQCIKDRGYYRKSGLPSTKPIKYDFVESYRKVKELSETQERDAKSCQLLGVPGQSPSPVLAWPYIA